MSYLAFASQGIEQVGKYKTVPLKIGQYLYKTFRWVSQCQAKKQWASNIVLFQAYNCWSVEAIAKSTDMFLVPRLRRSP